jgi:hypothetical protein
MTSFHENDKFPGIFIKRKKNPQRYYVPTEEKLVAEIYQPSRGSTAAAEYKSNPCTWLPSRSDVQAPVNTTSSMASFPSARPVACVVTERSVQYPSNVPTLSYFDCYPSVNTSYMGSAPSFPSAAPCYSQSNSYPAPYSTPCVPGYGPAVIPMQYSCNQMNAPSTHSAVDPVRFTPVELSTMQAGLNCQGYTPPKRPCTGTPNTISPSISTDSLATIPHSLHSNPVCSPSLSSDSIGMMLPSLPPMRRSPIVPSKKKPMGISAEQNVDKTNNFSFTDFFLAYMSSCNRGVDGNFKGRRSCTNHPRSNPSSPRFSTRSSRNNSNYSKSFSADNLHRVSTSSNASMDSACENDDDVSPTAESEKERKEKEKAAVDPRKYKTRMCRNWELTGSCPYEHTCCFAHGEKDLRDLAGNHQLLASIGYFSNVVLLSMTNGVKPALPPHTLYQQPSLFPCPQTAEDYKALSVPLPDNANYPFQQPLPVVLKLLTKQSPHLQPQVAPLVPPLLSPALPQTQITPPIPPPLPLAPPTPESKETSDQVGGVGASAKEVEVQGGRQLSSLSLPLRLIPHDEESANPSVDDDEEDDGVSSSNVIIHHSRDGSQGLSPLTKARVRRSHSFSDMIATRSRYTDGVKATLGCLRGDS